ncbi:MAG: glycosyltransferase [Planctomycetota bacterium]
MTTQQAVEGAATSQPSAAGISLVLPAWNESETLPLAVREADQALRSAVGLYEIIVVDDGSTDETAERLQALEREYSALRVVRHETNRGYGAALRTGFAAARCEFVAFTDADLQFDLHEISRFVFLARDYDIVCGYRIDRQDSPLRCFYSRVYNALVRALIGTSVRDIDCAFKLFRREELQELPITTDGFLVNTELLTSAQRNGLSVVEVGVTHRPRAGGESTVSVLHIPAVLAGLLRFWWSRVQFPGGESRRSDGSGLAAPSGPGRRLRWMQGLLLVLAGLLLLTGLSYPLIDRDETRYAEIPREMMVTGDWLVPQLNFKTYYDKPPLLYWACAASYSVFGVSEWAARIVPALCGVFTLSMTIAFGNRLFNHRVGLLGGVALLLSPGFLGGSRVLLIDGLLTCCVSLSVFAACEALRRGRMITGWWLVASVAVGLGCLAKGPIAIVLFLPPVVVYAWLTDRAFRPRPRHWLLFFVVVAAMTAPWLVAVSQKVPDFAYQFFYRHNVERFGGAFHAKPVWFFLPVLLLGGFPCSLLTFHCLGYLASREESVRRRRTPQLGLLVLWALWCLAFFSASSCKLPMYILPAAPAMALVLAKYLDDLLWQKTESRRSIYPARHAPWIATALSILLGLGFVSFGAWKGFESQNSVVFVVCCGAVLLLAVEFLRRRVRRPDLAWGVTAVAALVLAALVLHREIPRYAASQTLFGPTSPLRRELASDPAIHVVTVGHEWSEVPYYLNRTAIENVDWLETENVARNGRTNCRVLIVARQSIETADLMRSLPRAGHLVSIAERGKAQVLLVDLPKSGTLVAEAESEATSVR